MIEGLVGTLDKWEKEAQIRTILLRGAGRAFCAGGGYQGGAMRKAQKQKAERRMAS